MAEKIKIAVLMGGISSEREISLLSGQNIFENLNKDKYHAVSMDFTGDLAELVALKGVVDVVFLALHGYGGEDGKVQAVLDLLKIPYTGSKVLASAMAMDKNITKNIYQLHNIPSPKGVVLASGGADGDIKEQAKYIERSVTLPIIVKPNSQGSSVGMSWVYKTKEIYPALKLGYKYDDKLIIEEMVEGVEISVPVYSADPAKALPIIEIVPKSGKFDFESKYTDGLTEEICPARISEKIAAKAMKYAVLAHNALGCSGVSRTDMIVKSGGEIVVIETNTTPGMTKNSLVPISVRTAGIDIGEFLDIIIEQALKV